MLKRAFVVAALVALSGCTTEPQSRVDRLGQEYLDLTFAANPGAGVAAGLHQHDGRPLDLSASAISVRRASLLHVRAAIDALLARGPLTAEDRLRARALRAAIEGDLFVMDALGAYSRNPMTYAGAVDVSIYAKRDFAPKPRRMESAARVLESVPAVVAAARRNLDRVMPRVYIETAIKIAEGQADFAQADLVTAFADVADPALQARLRRAADVASQSMAGYVAWLRAERLPIATDDFAIGRPNFARMLRETELVTQTPEQVLEIGLRELERQNRAFVEAAAQIDPTRRAADVWIDVQRDHPSAQSLIPDTRAHLAAIKQFLVERDIIRFPSDREVIVDETPAFLRATSFASMDTPGVFERIATESFYYVTPPERDWNAAKTEEWLTAFNYYTTDVVSIHEAYPGHFVQALHLHDSDLPGYQKYVGSYAFIEGWAHYCEQMALDEGFPPPALATAPHAAAKYRMAQASEALLRVCRLVAAIRMHCQGQSLDEATRFFMDRAYYTEATARAEAERGSYDPGYCMYTLGKLQILTLREDWRRQEGDAFTLRRFHDEVLRHGQPPVRLLRERMLREASIWERTVGE